MSGVAVILVSHSYWLMGAKNSATKKYKKESCEVLD